jgi:hypothetical protein
MNIAYVVSNNKIFRLCENLKICLTDEVHKPNVNIWISSAEKYSSRINNNLKYKVSNYKSNPEIGHV